MVYVVAVGASESFPHGGWFNLQWHAHLERQITAALPFKSYFILTRVEKTMAFDKRVGFLTFAPLIHLAPE